MLDGGDVITVTILAGSALAASSLDHENLGSFSTCSHRLDFRI